MNTLFRYTDGQKGELHENLAVFYFWDGVQWVEESASPEVDANPVATIPNHFSAGAVMGEIIKNGKGLQYIML